MPKRLTKRDTPIHGEKPGPDGMVIREKDHCPICGYHFDEVEDVNVCPTKHYGQQKFTPEELITDMDDYLWCH